MKGKIIVVIIVTVLLNSCSPKVTTSLLKGYPPLKDSEDVRVLSIREPVPDGSERIGTVKIHGVGLGEECGFDFVIEKAKMEARKSGGNTIKIMEHKLPSTFGNSCHRIKAVILNAGKFNATPAPGKEENTNDVNYAVLHVYRYGGYGSLVDYNLYLGDSLLCRVGNNFYERIKIYTHGKNTLWAKTETLSEVPVNIEFGREYFLRCAVTMGILVGRPDLELAGEQNGRIEVDSIISKEK